MENMFCAKTDDVVRMFNNVSFAALTRTEMVSRPSELWARCVEIHVDSNRMRMTATDRRRLSTAFIDEDGYKSNEHANFKCSVIVDDLRFALKSFRRSKGVMLYTTTNDVDGESVLRVTDSNRTVEVRVAEEELKDWESIISVLDKEPMAVILDRCEILANLRGILGGVKLGEIRRQDRSIILDIQNGKVSIMPSEDMIERAKQIRGSRYIDVNDESSITSIQRISNGEADTYVGYKESDHFMSGRIQLNHTWLMNALESIDSDKVALRYGDRDNWSHMQITMYEGKIIELMQPVTITSAHDRFDLTQSPTVHKVQPMRLGERGWKC